MKLGKNLHYRRTYSRQNCTKLYHEKKLWKLGKVKSREKKEFKAALHKIARQIIRFAESACAGIKFEKLFSHRHMHHGDDGSCEFSFENGSFVTLLHLVEKRALNRGIPVKYVNPSNTSKRCSRCGGFGRRVRKRFECPLCGMVINADVNAAFNIAATPCTSDKAELHEVRTTRKMMRKRARDAQAFPGNVPASGEFTCRNEIFSPWNNVPLILDES
jgi:putative transposase